MGMIQLLYMSTAVEPFSDEALTGLLEEARAKNKYNRITGVLLYCSGVFIQLLEGDEIAVKDCYQKICKDSRHHNLSLIMEVPIQERFFGLWEMGFKSFKEISPKEFPGFSDLLSEGFDQTHFKDNATVAMDFMKYMKKSMLELEDD